MNQRVIIGFGMPVPYIMLSHLEFSVWFLVVFLHFWVTNGFMFWWMGNLFNINNAGICQGSIFGPFFPCKHLQKIFLKKSSLISSTLAIFFLSKSHFCKIIVFFISWRLIFAKYSMFWKINFDNSYIRCNNTLLWRK